MNFFYIACSISLLLAFLGWLFLRPERFNGQMSNAWLDENCPDYTRARWNR